MRVYDIFVMMYYALDSEYQDNPSEELRLFLSDLNPFRFADEGSADPAAYEDFKNAYSEYGTVELNGYTFAKEYIRRECSPLIQEVFTPITNEEWQEAYEIYQKR